MEPRSSRQTGVCGEKMKRRTSAKREKNERGAKTEAFRRLRPLHRGGGIEEGSVENWAGPGLKKGKINRGHDHDRIRCPLTLSWQHHQVERRAGPQKEAIEKEEKEKRLRRSGTFELDQRGHYSKNKAWGRK